MMRAAEYLPSSKFSLTAGSIALAGMLILGAQYYVAPHVASPSLATAPDATEGYQDPNWQSTLEQVQTEAAIAAPQAPDPQVVDQFKEAAKSGNVTDSVARTLFVSLSSAQASGLGNDLPTQDKLIAEASAQLQSGQTSGYAAGDFTPSPQDKASIKRWANGVMTAINAHPAASRDDTYVAIGQATDSNDKTKLTPLQNIGAAYRAIAADIVKLPVPPTLLPLDAKITNTFVAIAATYPDLSAIGGDPLRGLAALQNLNFYLGQQARLFTNIQEQLAKNGILFSKDEPGAAWSVYAPTLQ